MGGEGSKTGKFGFSVVVPEVHGRAKRAGRLRWAKKGDGNKK